MLIFTRKKGLIQSTYKRSHTKSIYKVHINNAHTKSIAYNTSLTFDLFDDALREKCLITDLLLQTSVFSTNMEKNGPEKKLRIWTLFAQ